MHILFTPNSTGSGHNMRTLAIIKKVQDNNPNVIISVVLLSLKNIFYKLYQEAGCNVIVLNNSINDHSKVSHLSKFFDWKTYIEGYISNSFLNSSLILKYTALYIGAKPDLIVSDYNLSASAAAHIGKFKHAMVTERYDFTLFQVSNKELTDAGFIVNADEITAARESLHRIFEGIISSSSIILTDKPYIAELDKNTALENAAKSGKVKFVGPMVRDIPTKNTQADDEVLRSFGIELNAKDKLIVASVGGTTMFIENKHNLIQKYIDLYNSLRKKIPELKMVLISRENIEPTDGIYVFDYIPNWLPLLNRANVLLSAPGWITATEVALVRVPVVYVLADQSEYHEVEASKRLKELGFNSFINPDIEQLTDIVLNIISEENIIDLAPYLALAPFGDGASKAARYLIGAIEQDHKINKSSLAHDRITRLLLSNNGSTTVLLESYLDTPIRVNVTSQDTTILTDTNLSVRINKYFKIENSLVKRESELLNNRGEIVCLATVYFENIDDAKVPNKDSFTPLGKLLTSQNIKQHRTVISTGNTDWPIAGSSPECAFKEYIISCEDGTNIYVFERFNPDFFPNLLIEKLA